jgi:hypothetical protein
MANYLTRLRQDRFQDGSILLILGTYSIHKSAEVRATARQVAIDHIFIPSGCTDRLQMFDRRVFGVLKAYARRIWRQNYHKIHGEKMIQPMIIIGLVDAWE